MRIHRGLIDRDADLSWLQLKANHAVLFFESELVTHFQAEEMFLFPAMEGMPGSTEVIDELLTEHSKIGRLIDQLLVFGLIGSASRPRHPELLK